MSISTPADVFKTMVDTIKNAPSDFNSEERHQLWLNIEAAHLRSQLLRKLTNLMRFYSDRRLLLPECLENGKITCLTKNFDNRYTVSILHQGLSDLLTRWGFERVSIYPSHISRQILIEIHFDKEDSEWADCAREMLTAVTTESPPAMLAAGPAPPAYVHDAEPRNHRMEARLLIATGWCMIGVSLCLLYQAVNGVGSEL